MGENTLKPVFNLTGINEDIVEREVETLISENSSKIEKLAQSCMIDFRKELSAPPIAMNIESNGKQIALFTKGNFSIVTGKAKSRKSFLISMLIAGAIKGTFQDYFSCPSYGMNILFDTEQAEYKVQQTSKRICNLAGDLNPENFISYHLRTLDPIERLEVIEQVISTTPNLNFVAIDGIVDLEIDPILQAEQAQNIISKLMRWTDVYKIHIVCVLHYNKTVSTLLGHLGSFAHRKADSVIEVVKDTENENISFVNPVDCREMEFSPFAFSVDEFGIPKIETDFEPKKSKAIPKTENQKRQKSINPSSLQSDEHDEILRESFKILKEQSYSDLWKVFKQVVSTVCKDKTKDLIGDNKAKEFITYYLLAERIVKIEVNKKALYTLKEQKELEFKDPSLAV